MEHTVTAINRSENGRAAVRRLRRDGKVPGIVYGGGKNEPTMISIEGKPLERQLSQESFHSSILNLQLDDKKIQVLLRDFQSHPVTDHILHVDFQAVDAQSEITVTIPFHFVEAQSSPGVKLNHGIFSVTLAEIEVSCLPKDLPENITVDVSHLDLNQSLHLSEVQVPTGVSFTALARGEDPSVATVLPPQKEEVEVTETTEEETTEEQATDTKDSTEDAK